MKKNTDFAIALAWPQTYCKQPGSWYDRVTAWLGINKNNYYKAGHAALVLIDTQKNKCHYFDFGRYHSPFQHGRVRSEETDHDLKLKITPHISDDGKSVKNLKDILDELQLNPACHGEGVLHASSCRVNFQSAFNKAKKMQRLSPIPYGPFQKQGSNCSRFVNTVLQAGNPAWTYRMRLKYLVPFTPTPLNNVNSLQHRHEVPIMRKSTLFVPVRKLNKTELRSTMLQPERHPDIPEKAKWLSGEGAGSWFVIEFLNQQLKLTRYSTDGKVECHGLYINHEAHDPIQELRFQITYPSNCKELTLRSKKAKLKFVRVYSEGA